MTISCGNDFLCGAKNHPFSKSMVDHNKKRVKGVRKGKVSDEIAGDLLEWASGDQVDGSERGNSGICVGFVLLANGTTSSIFMDEGGEAGPPEFGGN